MTSAEGSFLGLAEQTAKGTPNTTDADFKYLLFREGAGGPQNISIPLDPEVGGGAMLRSVVKVGVTSGAALDIIPRPESLGLFLYGVTGAVDSDADTYINGIVGPVLLTVGAQTGYIERIHQPDGATAFFVVGSADDMAGNVVLHGTLAGVAGDVTFTFPGGTYVAGTRISTPTTQLDTILSIDFPAQTTGPGEYVSVGYDSDYTTHVFTLGADQFSAPYYTVRNAPGALWGEQYQDCRINNLALSFRGARFVEGAASFLGGLPKKVSTTGWDALTQVDGGPQFLSPYGDIELPTGTVAKVLEGSFAAQAAIPLDQQFIIGKLYPDAMDIVQRGFVLNLLVKVEDETLYKKTMYDHYGTDNWTAYIFKESNINIGFRSDVGQYSLKIAANGQTGAASSNVAWSATPVRMTAGRQLVYSITGVFLADPVGTTPLQITLVNKRASY